MSQTDKESRYQEAIARLAASELRTTGGRRALLKVLTGSDRPMTVDQVFSQLEPGTLDQVNVYRSLAAMEGEGLVRRSDFGDGTYRYEYDLGPAHGHYVRCRDCGRTDRLQMCAVEALERYAADLGYTKVGHVMDLQGRCPECEVRVGRTDG